MRPPLYLLWLYVPWLYTYYGSTCLAQDLRGHRRGLHPCDHRRPAAAALRPPPRVALLLSAHRRGRGPRRPARHRPHGQPTLAATHPHRPHPRRHSPSPAPPRSVACGRYTDNTDYAYCACCTDCTYRTSLGARHRPRARGRHARGAAASAAGLPLPSRPEQAERCRPNPTRHVRRCVEAERRQGRVGLPCAAWVSGYTPSPRAWSCSEGCYIGLDPRTGGTPSAWSSCLGPRCHERPCRACSRRALFSLP